MLLAIALLAAHSASGATLTLDEYTSALDRIHGHIATGALGAAKAEGEALRGATVVWPQGRFHADETLLDAIANVRRADRRLLERIDLTLRELRGSGASGARPDPRLLRQVAAEQDVPDLVPGGRIGTSLTGEGTLLERIAGSVESMWEWLSERVGKLLEWILDLVPTRGKDESAATFGLRWIIIVIVVAIVLVLVLLAIRVLSRSNAAAPVVATSSEPIGSRRDEDPLSRGATEWERYAARLASEGRFREAIRAWYHAVLVTCYATGVLHFRKGRTNWEYIATLAPSLPWRAELIQLTRRFELEWYGHEASSADALAECSRRAQSILGALRQRGAA